MLHLRLIKDFNEFDKRAQFRVEKRTLKTFMINIFINVIPCSKISSHDKEMKPFNLINFSRPWGK